MSQASLFVALNACKSADVLRRSLHDPAIQVAYGPLERDARRQAITFVSGMAKPFAEAMAGAIMVVFAVWVPTRQLSLLVIALTAGWLLLVRPLSREFQQRRGSRASQNNG